MSQALTRYQGLFDSVASRRRREPAPKGLDKLAGILRTRLASRRITLRWLRAEAERVDARLSPALRAHSDAALDDYVRQIREVFLRGRQDDEAVRRGLAATREVARRETGQEAFVVQLMGALALYHGRIVQMLTGEGKTLTGSVATPLIAWRHRHVHVFTVNDYLAKRDAESREPIYRRCLLSCAAIQQEMDPPARAAAYALPIVYGTPKQIVADWLRDQIRLGPTNSAWAGRAMLEAGGPLQAGGGGGPLVPGLRAAVVDECDAVLIDEGVVPLIIAQSRRGDEMAPVYQRASAIAASLEPKLHYSVDHLRKKAELTASGRERALEFMQGETDAVWKAPRRGLELVRQALVARHCYLLGRQYAVVDGRVVIVDEYTGRFLADRSWEHGLHQAVEAKEGLEITADRETLARMSFQRFFRSYPVLSGMTGTAADATREMESTYFRRVTAIPTNRPVARVQWPTRIFGSAEARWEAAAESVRSLHAQGRPVLAGTRSIEASEHLAARLTALGVPHRVLNANHDKEEAGMIARAGERGAVTVATNMAGRGTDIILDAAARKAGGLHVVLTEMHAARRIDRQFIGRAGRQGDPGSAQFLLSLEDELVNLHARRLTASLRAVAGKGELSGALRRAAERLFGAAQAAGQARDRRMRAETLRQDDWMEKYMPGA